MYGIRVEAQLLDLFGDSQFALESNNPLLQEEGQRGNYSLPINAPRTPHNDQLLGHPARFDQLRPRVLRFGADLLDELGAELLTGSLVLRSITPTAYVLNLEYGASEVMQRLKARPLSSFLFGGLHRMEPSTRDPLNPDVGVFNTIRYMDEVTKAFPAFPFVFAPISNNDANGEWDSYPIPSVTFNQWGSVFNNSTTGEDGFQYQMFFGPGGAQTGAGVSPLPLIRLEYLVKEIFREIRVPLIEDFFAETEMRLAVLVPTGSYMRQTPRGLLSIDDWWMEFLIGDHLPDMSAGEFLRKLFDSFGLHFDVTPTGEARLLRSRDLIQTPDTTDLTLKVGPAFTNDLEGSQSVVVRNRLPENDRYAEEFASAPEPEMIVAEPVATVADLPAATEEDVVILVTSEARYYRGLKTVSNATPPVTTFSWEPGPFYLPEVTVGAEESQFDYEVGFTYTPTRKLQYVFQGYADVDTLTMLEPARTPQHPKADLSKNLRLAFYRGLRPVPGALNLAGGPAVIPWVTLGNTAPDGTIIGLHSLQVAGGPGLVNKFLRPLLQLRRVRGNVRFPSLLTAQDFRRLDLTKPVRIRGDEFMIRKATIGLPLRKPGVLHLVPRRDVEEA